MAELARPVVFDGRSFLITMCVRGDRITVPTREFFSALRERRLMPNTGAPPLAEQPRYLVRLVGVIRNLSEGRAISHSKTNYLGGGLWEFREWGLRLSFFDTNGSGIQHPQLPAGWDHWSGTHVLPVRSLNEELRLGFGFSKQSQHMDPKHLAEAWKVMQEDLSHDSH